MNAQEALGLLDSIASRVAMSREDHGKVIEATRVLHLALAELDNLRQEVDRLQADSVILGNLRQEVDRLQAEIERLQPDDGGEPVGAE